MLEARCIYNKPCYLTWVNWGEKKFREHCWIIPLPQPFIFFFFSYPVTLISLFCTCWGCKSYCFPTAPLSRKNAWWINVTSKLDTWSLPLRAQVINLHDEVFVINNFNHSRRANLISGHRVNGLQFPTHLETVFTDIYLVLQYRQEKKKKKLVMLGKGKKKFFFFFSSGNI